MILRNAARHQALQINAAVGEDIWRKIDRLVIEDNIAEDQAVQVNHGTELEVMMMFLGHQERRINAARDQRDVLPRGKVLGSSQDPKRLVCG